MCKFFSGLILRNGDVLHHPLLDSHSDLVTYFGLPDTSTYHQHFAKFELTPTTAESWTDASLWSWRIDEPTTPGWLTDIEATAEATARALVQRMVMVGHRQFVLEGAHIVPTEASIGQLRGGRIVNLCGGAVSAIYGGTVSAIYGGTVPSYVSVEVVLGVQARVYYDKLNAATKTAKQKKATARKKVQP